MTAGGGIKVWESGTAEPPPTGWDRWLTYDERLLWSAAVPESANKPHYRRVVVMTIVFAAVFACSVPFGETVSEYCLRDGGRRCARYYWVNWIAFLLFVFEAFRSVWRYLHAGLIAEPNLYAITTRRALFMPRSNANLFRACALTPVHIDMWGDSLRFGRTWFGWPRWFHGLGRDHANKALEWVSKAPGSG